MRTLGLDLGPNSIGWAIVDHDTQSIVATGVRVFPAGVDQYGTKKEKPKNEDRRIARGMRRQIARRARRKQQLRQLLIDSDMFPADGVEQHELFALDPYLLRARSLRERLHPHEIGRALLHLNQRRGFLSNRKTDRERKKEVSGMLAEINELAGAIAQSGQPTLGAYLAEHRRDPHTRIRGQHTRRDMYEHEFDALWNAQQAHHPNLLTDQLRDRISRIIFFQRKMYWPKSVIGLCELEPKRRRCPRADRLAQRFRVLQEINNLEYLDTDSGEVRPLDLEQRAIVLGRLERSREVSFDQLRKALGFSDTVEFNLERGKRTKLLGMVTDALLAHKNLFGPAWHDRPEEEKNTIVRALIDAEDEDALLNRAINEWGLDEAAADRLLDLDLPSGYASLSREALTRLIPPMERGLKYMTADDTPSALSEAGYLRPDQIQRRVHDELPHPPDLANPVVVQALYEVRKVVNAIIREYGRPDEVHVELAREMKMGTKKRQQLAADMREREAERDHAADEIRKLGIKPTREAIQRYRLWREQRMLCPYTGREISLTQLFGGEIDIDHILPFSRCLDDSHMNKVVSFRSANNEKGNRTPFEWLGHDAERHERVIQATKHLPFPKRRRFVQKELDLDDFVERQLNDTRYLSRAVMEFIRLLFDQPHHVLCPRGEHTAMLRRHWGLNTVLRDDGLDLKNRDDHRHHAVDAVVLALTSRSVLQRLARIGQDSLPEPWSGFRSAVEQAVNTINVSHRSRRKVSGALHEETIYGPTGEPGVFVMRKRLEDLTPSMVEDIRDPAIRELVRARLAEHGIESGRGRSGSIPKEVWKEPLCMPSGVPVKKVRVLKRDQSIEPIRGGAASVKPGSTHHLCLFEWQDRSGTTERDAVFVSMLEAKRRVSHREPIIQRAHPDLPAATFLMSLSQNEMVLLHHNGQEILARFETAASTSKQMWFRIHHVGGRSSDKTGLISKRPSTFDGRKVTVDPIGRIRWAND